MCPIHGAIAVLRYHLYDIEVVINKTLVYGSLAVFITGVYVAIVVGIGSFAAPVTARNQVLSCRLLRRPSLPSHSIRSVNEFQHLANRMVYGKRATPYEVLAEFAERMAGTYATEDLLPRMARTLAEGTPRSGPTSGWPAAASSGTLRAGRRRAAAADHARASPSWATRQSGTDTILPVQHQAEVLGALSITKRRARR